MTTNDVCRAVRRVRLLPRGAAAYLLVRESRRSQLDGFELVDASEAPSAEAAAKIGQALHLIAEVLPAAYARLQRDVRRVILLRAGGPEYWPFADAELRLERLLPDATELEEFAREKLSRKWWTEDAQRARRERTRRELG